MGGKSPEKPVKATAAAPAIPDTVTGQAAEARGNVADDTAKAAIETQKPTVEDDGLPDNQYSEYYRDLKDRLEQNPDLRGPLTNAILSILLLAAKYGHYADLMPGRFIERLDKDENLKDKKLNKDQADKVCAGTGKTDDELFKNPDGTDKEDWKKFDIDKASTKYACNVLWGIDDIENASSLAAYLKHTVKETEEGDVPIYELSTLEDIKQQENIARGTILIFISDLKKGDKVVAFATGTKDEFKYYDADTDKVEIFHLRGDDSKVKSGMGLMVAMIPNTAAYSAAKETPAEGETAAAAAETPTEAAKPAEAPAAAPTEAVQPFDEFKKTADAALTKLEKNNLDVEMMIAELDNNPNPDNIAGLITTAEAAEKASREALASIQQQVEDLKIKLSLSTEDEKILDDYFARLKALVEHAGRNADHASLFKSELKSQV